MIQQKKLTDGSFVYSVIYKTEIEGKAIQFDTRNESDAYKLEQAIRNLTVCSQIWEG